MDASKFAAPAWGRAVSTGAGGYVAFIPGNLPRSLELEPATVQVLADAATSVGRLAGAGRLLPEPHLLLLPYLTREAVASSRIEGTQASISDVFESRAVGGRAPGDVQEVINYMHALDHGIARLDSLPVSSRLMREMHEVLMTGVRGQERTPGQLRTSQNWIGGDRPMTAVFVPPTVEDMKPALSDWEHFAHDRQPQLPLLVRTALLHYQFETIHPFLDGNGRLGRLFIVLHLIEQRAIPGPLLPLSAALEQRRSEYYERLQAVRERGEIQEWLRFFLQVVGAAADDAVHRAERLVDLRERYRGRLAGTRSRAVEVVDVLMGEPVVTTRRIATELAITIQGAGHLLRQLARFGIVTEQRRARGAATLWRAQDVLPIVND